ncbi:MAG: hypothetical protein KDD35_04115 [Bdellovibrionales bacterium]|nr:hypothetical protein [Bdellovibrionales bacterium]
MNCFSKKMLMCMKFVFALAGTIGIGRNLSQARTDIREVSATSCEVVQVNLGLGMTTQIVFEQEPKVTLYADKKHFKITTTPLSPRSLAIIPFVESSELDSLQASNKRLSAKMLASELDEALKTNLVVIFENNNQLMFLLRFVEKDKADYLLTVKQVFNKDCKL